MELRKRKWIYNNLPRYNGGKPDGTTQAQIDIKRSLGLPPDHIGFGYDKDLGIDLSTLSNIGTTKQTDQMVQDRLTDTSGNRILNATPQILTNALNFTGSVINANTLGRSSADILRDAGTRVAKNGDFVWQKQNEIDSNREMSNLHKQHVSNTISTMGTGVALGASIGSIFPGAGTAIGAVGGAIIGGIAGLIGGGNTHAKLRKRIYNAQQQRINNNNYNFAAAQGDWINQQYDLNHDYTQDGQIYVS